VKVGDLVKSSKRKEVGIITSLAWSGQTVQVFWPSQGLTISMVEFLKVINESR
jgi:hypothetical protein